MGFWALCYDRYICTPYLKSFSLTISVVIYYCVLYSITNPNGSDIGLPTINHTLSLAALTSSALQHQQNGAILRPRYYPTLISSPTTRFHNPPNLSTRPSALDNKMYNLPLRHSRIPHHPSTHPHRILPPLSLSRSLLLRIAGGEIPWRIGDGADCEVQ